MASLNFLKTKLYKFNKNGKEMVWSIDIIKNDIGAFCLVTQFGQTDGKIQELTQKAITKGKNIGKKNETTAEEQARSEAMSLYFAKLDEGYERRDDDSISFEIYETHANRKKVFGEMPEPMLAETFSNKSKINFPCCIQPKYDGIRCLSVQKEVYFLEIENKLLDLKKLKKNWQIYQLKFVMENCIQKN